MINYFRKYMQSFREKIWYHCDTSTTHVGKVECVFVMVISSELRLRRRREEDHKEHDLHFTIENTRKLGDFRCFAHSPTENAYDLDG